jgi:hypothetical protein
MFKGCLVLCSMRLGVPFIAPRDLGVVGAPFGRFGLPSVCGCTGLSSAHQTLHSAMATNHLIVWFSVLGAPDRPMGGTGLSGAPCDHCPPVDVGTNRWLAGTHDYSCTMHGWSGEL